MENFRFFLTKSAKPELEKKFSPPFLTKCQKSIALAYSSFYVNQHRQREEKNNFSAFSSNSQIPYNTNFGCQKGRTNIVQKNTERDNRPSIQNLEDESQPQAVIHYGR